MRTIHYCLAAALALALTAGTAVAQEEGPGNSGCRDSEAVSPGPNGCNNFGLCMAYFAGSEQGRENKRQAPPFAALEDAACGECDEGCECDMSNNENGEMCNDDTQECVAQFCPDSNPAGNGPDPSDGSPGQNNGNGNA